MMCPPITRWSFMLVDTGGAHTTHSYRNAEVSLIADSAPGIVTEAFVRSYMRTLLMC